MISTGCNSYTKNIGILTANELKKVPLIHCLKDNNDFLRKIDEFNKNNDLKDCKNFFMVTFDIESVLLWDLPMLVIMLMLPCLILMC